jgi:uncharacterized integral membrane protein
VKFLHYLRWTLGLLVLAVLLLFALSNGQPVELSLFPTGLSTTLPLSVVVLGALGLGFLAGGLVAWFAGLRHRRAAKRAEAALRDIQAKSQTAVTT